MSAPDAGWVTIALLGKTRGNRGELTALALSSRPERYRLLREVYVFGVGLPAGGERLEIESTWFHERTLVLKFRAVDTISDAERLSGAEVRVPISERVALNPGEFFESDIISCEIVDRSTGEPLGRVTGWQDAGGAGLLEIDNGEWLLPFARSMCIDIDPGARRITVELPEGLKDLNRP